MLHCCKFAPECYRIRHDHIRPDLLYYTGSHVIKRERRRNQQFGREHLVLADTIRVFLIFHLKIVSVTAYECCTGTFYFFPEFFK